MFVGLLFIILGFLFLLEILIPTFNVNFGLLWPIIMISFSVYQIIKKRKNELILWILLFIGIWSFLRELNIIPVEYKKIFGPLFLIVIGIIIVFKNLSFKKKIYLKTTSGVPNYYGIFSGIEEKIVNENFLGTNIYSVFGGVELDLSEIKIKEKEVIINVYSVFGGTDLTLPKDINIKVNTISIFGSTDNIHKEKNDNSKSTIYINSYAIFGGNAIK